MAAFENANDRKALQGTIPGRQLHPGRVQDESPGICSNLLREWEAAPGSELRQETWEPAAQVHGGADGGAGDAADRDIMDVVDRGHHSRLLPRFSEEARKEALSTLPSNMHELEAGGTLANIVQGLGLQSEKTLFFFRGGPHLEFSLAHVRERDLDGYKVRVRDLSGVVARHLDVDLRRGLPGSFQKRLFRLAGSANTPWGRAIREQVALRRWYTGGQQVEHTCTLGRPSEEEVDFQRQLTCPFREDVRRVFLHIRAKESANVHSPPPPNIGDVVRDPELPASLRDWLISSCIV
ncbi:hypothetical protein CYMTET_4885 [Cymbomonas tetramitiformis]|uniref:Uncharacterized protein n=1 Tax=Cymbomonas tetramitiformis TaxID=36881 RepID=A0AAE0LK23_9CHLO|nr:hypothetical protein CYMTET_4885 [Cymbomonas tetramitiformis]